jgi:hypothetical protein
MICSEWPTSSFASSDIFDTTLALNLWSWRGETWPSQANRIFSHLGIMSKFEDYGTSETVLGQFLINPFKQLSLTGSILSYPFQQCRVTLPRATYFCAHEDIFEQDRHHSDGPSVRHTGPSIYRVPSILAWWMQLL